MKKSIIYLEDYKRDLINKKELDSGDITLEDLSLEELDGVSGLYVREIKSMQEEIEQRKNNIKKLQQENNSLRNLIKDGDN